MDQSNPPTTADRRGRRSQVFMAATLEVSGASLPVKLRNLSSVGALVEGKVIPVEGTTLVFRRNDLAVPARVAWVNGTRGGIAFDAILGDEDLLRHVPAPQPRPENPFRRPGIAGPAPEWIWRPSRDRGGN